MESHSKAKPAKAQRAKTVELSGSYEEKAVSRNGATTQRKEVLLRCGRRAVA